MATHCRVCGSTAEFDPSTNLCAECAAEAPDEGCGGLSNADADAYDARAAEWNKEAAEREQFFIRQAKAIQVILLQRTIDLIEEGNTPKALDLLRQLRDAARE